jgi:hypothetical protein
MNNSRDKNSLSKIPLKDAWYIFANAKHKKILEHQRRNQNSQHMTYNSNRPNWQNAIENSNNIIQNYQNTKYIMDIMEQQVRHKLSHGELTSYGSPVGSTAQSKRSLIPPEFWDNATIEWAKGSAWDDISQYRRIRVTVPDQPPATDTASGKTPGRPTQRDTIMEVIRACDRADSEFKSLDGKSKRARIRDQIERNHPNCDPYGMGCKDKTLEKYIRQYYKS